MSGYGVGFQKCLKQKYNATENLVAVLEVKVNFIALKDPTSHTELLFGLVYPPASLQQIKTRTRFIHKQDLLLIFQYWNVDIFL